MTLNYYQLRIQGYKCITGTRSYNYCMLQLTNHYLQMVEVRMKKLLKIPATVKPPPPEKIIGNLNWVSGDDVLIEYIKV